MATQAQTLRQPATWVARGLREYPLPILAVGFALWQVALPLVILLIFSFRGGSPGVPGPWTLDHYVKAYSAATVYTMLFNTALISLAATLLAMILAVFFAYLTERTDMPFRNVAWGLMLVPMAMPGILFGISWVFLLSPKIGLINQGLRAVLAPLGLELPQGPIDLYGLGGLIFLEGLRGVTTVFLMAVGAFRSLDPAMEEAAQASGAPWRHAFFRITLPLLTPALLSAFIYSFMVNLESLEIPMVVGLPAKIFVFSSYIFFAAQRSTPPDYGLSAALGSTFLVASLALVFWYRHVVGQAGRFATVTGKGYRPRVTRLGRWRYLAFCTFVVFFLLTIALPALVLFWRSVVPFFVPPSLDALSTLTFDHYRKLFAVDALAGATLNTLIVGVGTATLGMLVSLIIAWVVVRSRFGLKGALDGLTFLPHAIPGVIIGMALIYTYIQPPLKYLPIYGTLAVLVLGLTTSYLAFGTRLMNGAVAQIHQELEDAAHISGASWSQVLFRVVLPLLLPAFISGWIWVAAHALRSFSIPLMLQTPNTQVLAVQIWFLWDKGEAGPSSALGVILILVLGALTITGRWLVTRISRQE